MLEFILYVKHKFFSCSFSKEGMITLFVIQFLFVLWQSADLLHSRLAVEAYCSFWMNAHSQYTHGTLESDRNTREEPCHLTCCKWFSMVALLTVTYPTCNDARYIVGCRGTGFLVRELLSIILKADFHISQCQLINYFPFIISLALLYGCDSLNSCNTNCHRGFMYCIIALFISLCPPGIRQGMQLPFVPLLALLPSCDGVCDPTFMLSLFYDGYTLFISCCMCQIQSVLEAFIIFCFLCWF